jgi:hypothetical protein
MQRALSTRSVAQDQMTRFTTRVSVSMKAIRIDLVSLPPIAPIVAMLAPLNVAMLSPSLHHVRCALVQRSRAPGFEHAEEAREREREQEVVQRGRDPGFERAGCRRCVRGVIPAVEKVSELGLEGRRRRTGNVRGTTPGLDLALEEVGSRGLLVRGGGRRVSRSGPRSRVGVHDCVGRPGSPLSDSRVEAMDSRGVECRAGRPVSPASGLRLEEAANRIAFEIVNGRAARATGNLRQEGR